MEKKTIILTEKSINEVEKDDVANAIKKAFNIRNLHLKVYSDENWSLYEYFLYAYDGLPLLIEMQGECVVRHSDMVCFLPYCGKSGEYEIKEEKEYITFVTESKKPSFRRTHTRKEMIERREFI